jgi:hypothetical protein
MAIHEDSRRTVPRSKISNPGPLWTCGELTSLGTGQSSGAWQDSNKQETRDKMLWMEDRSTKKEKDKIYSYAGHLRRVCASGVRRTA